MLSQQELVNRAPVGMRPDEVLEDAVRYVREAANLLEEASVFFNFLHEKELLEATGKISAALNLKMERRFPDIVEKY